MRFVDRAVDPNAESLKTERSQKPGTRIEGIRPLLRLSTLLSNMNGSNYYRFRLFRNSVSQNFSVYHRNEWLITLLRRKLREFGYFFLASSTQRLQTH